MPASTQAQKTADQAQKTAEDVAVAKDQITRVLKILEGNGQPGMVKRLTDLEYEQREQGKEAVKVFEEIRKAIASLNDRLSCHLEEEQTRLEEDEKRREKQEEKVDNRKYAFLFEVLKMSLGTILGMVSGYLLYLLK